MESDKVKNKLPRVYQNPLNRKINNNMRVYYDQASNNVVVDSKPIFKSNEKQDVNKKIAELFSRNGYIFNLDVIIRTTDEVMETKIAGKIKNYIITLDNKVIPIANIIEINEKN